MPASPQPDLSHDDSARHRGRRILLGCSLAPVFVVVILGFVWYSAIQRAKERLAAQVAKVRARHEPLTTVELNDYYQPAPNRPDMTTEIVTALALSKVGDLKQLTTTLPIVGHGTDPPPPPQPWPQLAEAEAYLAQVEGVIATFHKVARTDGTARYPLDFSAGSLTLMAASQSLRQGAGVLSLQFHVHLHRSEMSDAVNCVLAQIALARTLDREPTLISQLVRLAIVSMAIENTRILMRQSAVADAELKRLQQGLRKIDFQSSLTAALAGERTFGYMACIDDRYAAEASVAVTPAEARQIAQRQPRRGDDAAKLLELNLRIAEAADKSLYGAMHETDIVIAERDQLGKSMLSRFSYMTTLQGSVAYKSATTAFARTASKRNCADVALAAELYRRKNGKWPEMLDDLVPDDLPLVPLDSFNGQPLKFVATEDEFKVYSVGQDGQDDGGKFSDKMEPGTDLGISISTRGTEGPP